MTNLISIGPFLREHRRSIDPATRALGTQRRLPARRGRRVSQEEIAEAAGISRVWYAMLESGAAPRTTPRLLAKIASILMLSASERLTLFRLALPELALAEESEVTGEETVPVRSWERGAVSPSWDRC
ncbi:MAG: helix-turn-helix domain-containing protein [Candidatus Eremiobacteraeota bacterium]|nr:helix-turn-helix domain-containing protein [Candidatus Eremiobacteraeota bacterium]